MILRNHQILIKKVAGIVALWVVVLLSVNALAHDEKAVPQQLLVGTLVAPPFAMKTADGRWEGLSIELMKMIARDLGVEYKLTEFNNISQIVEAVEKEELDAFIFDELVLKYLSKTDFPGRVHVLPGIFDHYYVGIAMPQGSALREPLNRALLEAIATDDWLRLVEGYIGTSIR